MEHNFPEHMIGPLSWENILPTKSIIYMMIINMGLCTASENSHYSINSSYSGTQHTLFCAFNSCSKTMHKVNGEGAHDRDLVHSAPIGESKGQRKNIAVGTS